MESKSTNTNERLIFKIENARIGFRNFAGEEGKYNPAGNRNFSIFLPDEVAKSLEEKGWAVRWLNSKEDEPPQAIINVKVQFGNYPPNMVLISNGKMTRLTEDMVSVLDYAELELVDLIIRGYSWEVSGRNGIKAYLKTGYFTLREDELAKKYAETEEGRLEVDHREF